MKRFQSISENLSYNDILQLDGAFSALHINYGKSPLFIVLCYGKNTG